MSALDILFVAGVIFVLIKMFLIKREVDMALNAEHSIRRAMPKDEDEEREVILLKTECIEGQIYVWNSQTNAFLAQGKSIEDVLKFFVEHYPGKKFIFAGEINEQSA